VTMPGREDAASVPIAGRSMRGLYAIVDVGLLGARRIDPIAFAGAVLSAEPAAIQLRAKDATARQTLGLLRMLAPMCRRIGVPLVANDRVDLAVAADCDMVHVGQEDLPIASVRQVASHLGVGVSTHTPDQLDSALSFGPSYVAFGPVFETSTKKNPDPVVGIAGLGAASLRARSRGVPLVAIGGITHDRAHRLVGCCDAIAVIAALVPPVGFGDGGSTDGLVEVARRARALQDLFAAGPCGQARR
jgi:thiamine-phosphate pyrophosphorylase